VYEETLTGRPHEASVQKARRPLKENNQNEKSSLERLDDDSTSGLQVITWKILQ